MGSGADSEMIISRDRDKLLNAMIFFVKNTKHCHTLKLFKLLNFLDFEHFRQTGKTVTGLRYVAWKQGPAPNELWHEIQRGGGDDMQKAIQFVEKRDALTAQLQLRELRPKREFDGSFFSKRELEIMKSLAYVFDEINANDMSELSHHKNLPWKRVFGKGEGEGQEISPMLSLDSPAIIGNSPPSLEKDEIQFRIDMRAGG